MSSWSKISIFIGLFSSLMYLWLIVYNIAGIVKYQKINAARKPDNNAEYLTDDTRVMLPDFNVTDVYDSMEEVNVYIIMLILSIIMIWGVNIKNHHVVAPWLLIGGLFVVFGFGASTMTWRPKYVLDFTVLALQAIIWCPVYTCYQELRHSYYFKKITYIRPRPYVVDQPGNLSMSPTTEYKKL